MVAAVTHHSTETFALAELSCLVSKRTLCSDLAFTEQRMSCSAAPQTPKPPGRRGHGSALVFPSKQLFCRPCCPPQMKVKRLGCGGLGRLRDRRPPQRT